MMRAIQALATVLLLAAPAWAVAAGVNVNTADADTLARELHGVGERTAARIVDERRRGEFRSLDEFRDRVHGIGDKLAARNQQKIRFKD